MDTRTMLVVLLAAGCGVAATAWLRTGAYRREDEGGDLPAHLWVAVAAPVVGYLLAHGLAERPWEALPAPFALALAGLVLAAVDADVHRLPNAITLPLVPIVLLLLVLASALTDDWPALTRALIAALAVGGGAVLLAFTFFGRSLGMGDAKLLVSLSPTLAWLSWSHLVVGIWLGFVIGGICALALLLTRRATRGTQLAFGPYLVAGAVLAIALA